MGHLVGKDLYRRLGKKIDGLSARAPWNAQLYAVLKELYSEDDADVVIRMPYGLSTLDRLEKATGIERARLERQLASLCSRGLVIDLVLDGKTWYAPSPMVAVRVSELERLADYVSTLASGATPTLVFLGQVLIVERSTNGERSELDGVVASFAPEGIEWHFLEMKARGSSPRAQLERFNKGIQARSRLEPGEQRGVAVLRARWPSSRDRRRIHRPSD